jgi:tetratricopeptide (TPR) repeat protein
MYASNRRSGIPQIRLAAALWLCLCTAGIAAEAKKAPKKPIPKQKNAVEQLIFATKTYFRPAVQEKKDKVRQAALYRAAVRAYKAAVDYFPKTKHRIVAMQAHYKRGLCLLALKEKKKAAAAFLATFRLPYPGKILNRSHAAMIHYHKLAYRQLMDLTTVLSEAERVEVNNEK